MSAQTWSAGKSRLRSSKQSNDSISFYRALLKSTDGDFGKFVNTMKKPRDNAQKWRAFKNIARFFKNPVGYTYWKV